jgi:methylaspartate mutase epsilon subunit
MIKNKKLDDNSFLMQRRDVLSMWHTGKDVDLDEAVNYNKNLPDEKNNVIKLRRAKATGEIYTVTGMGKSTVEEHIELLQHVEKEGKADLLAISPDSLTRYNRFDQVQKYMEESKKTGESKLNGVPVVNIGVPGLRRIIESVKSPIALRGGMPDGRLLAEILCAGGCSFSCPDLLMDFWQHSAKTPYEYVVDTHQYVGRLMGYYEEHGIPMVAGVQGFYGAGIPPSLQAASIVVSALMLAEQGLKNISFICVAHGNLTQDVASSRARESVLRYYLDKFGYNDVELNQSLSFSLMQYPADLAPSLVVTFMNTVMVRLVGAVTNDVRTMAEAKAIPTIENIGDTYKIAEVIQNFVKNQKIQINQKDLEPEIQMEEKETKAIIDKVLEFGDGDILVGAAKAIESGVLDNPFAANRAAAGKVLGVKDCEGAVRYFDTGNLPFSKEIIDYHKEKITERERKQGIKVGYDTLVDDLYAVSKGYLV